MNLRQKELKKIGFRSEKAIELAMKLAQDLTEESSKEEILSFLKALQLEPEKHINDAHWGTLAAFFVGRNEKRKARQKRSATPSPYFKIYGKHQIDPEAIRQMENAMRLPITVKGALMADAHVGYGLPIGGVLATDNAVIPYGVGMDIGCRMCLSVFPSAANKIDRDRKQIKNIIMQETRFGLGEFNDVQDHEIVDRKEFREIKFLKGLHRKFTAQLGTSGHGNHFVDVGYVDVPEGSDLLGLQSGKYFAVLTHSGSRNFGAEVCKHYTRIARDKLGLKGEAAQLAWLELDSEEGQEYWAAMNLAGDYSHTNHRIIHNRLAKAFGEKPLKIFENHHNFAWKERLSNGQKVIVHRKGATPAAIGDIGIIPGTMASPAFIVSGKGNEDSINSASHGAGRVISRIQAKKTLSQKQMNDYLQQQGVELLGAGLDESPFAYKDIHEVMEQQKDLVDVLAKFYPKIVRME